MTSILIVHHAPSPNTQALLSALAQGVTSSEASVDCLSIGAFDCGPQHVIDADSILLFTPENFGYMSGAMKDFFDRCFYALENRTQGKAYALCVRAGRDGTGACRSVDSIARGLAWRKVAPPLILKGEVNTHCLGECNAYAQALALGTEMGIF